MDDYPLPIIHQIPRRLLQQMVHHGVDGDGGGGKDDEDGEEGLGGGDLEVAVGSFLQDAEGFRAPLDQEGEQEGEEGRQDQDGEEDGDIGQDQVAVADAEGLEGAQVALHLLEMGFQEVDDEQQDAEDGKDDDRPG